MLINRALYRLFGSLIILVSGCSSDTPSNICEQANIKVSKCIGVEAPSSTSCDTALAEDILSKNCDEISSKADSKSDGVFCTYFNFACGKTEDLFAGEACVSSEECAQGATCLEGKCFSGFGDDYFQSRLDFYTKSGEASATTLRPIVSASEAFQTRLALIEEATTSVHIVSYYLADDHVGQETVAALRRAAQRGVDVRVIVDGLEMSSQKSISLFYDLTDEGVEFILFNPFWGGSWYVGDLSDNNRMHQKILVVDGNQAIIGGRNLADDYFLDDHWRDSEVLLRGNIVDAIQEEFIGQWNTYLRYENDAECPSDRHRVVCSSAPISTDLSEYRGAPFDDNDETAPVRFISSTPWIDEHPAGYVAYLAHIRGARSHIDITNAYFIPPRRLRAALRDAAGRGVRVRVLTNSEASNDVPLTYWAGAAYFKDLSDAGVEVYVWDKTTQNTLHAKTMTVDDEVAIVGSWNMDSRSAVSNGESLVVIRDSNFAADARRVFEQDLAESKPAPTEFTEEEQEEIDSSRSLEPLL